MKTVAVIPGQADSIHLAELPKPSVHEVPNGRVALVQVLRVGVDGTDKEINAAEYGQAPPGFDFLVIGHECFGRVLEVGPKVSEFMPGDDVVPTIRRPAGSFYDQVGQYDMTLEDTYYERGINLRHGYLTELFVDDPEYLVNIPKGLKDIAVLLEPTSIIEKGIIQAYEAQRRFKIWRPKKAAVLDAGTVGLLKALMQAGGRPVPGLPPMKSRKYDDDLVVLTFDLVYPPSLIRLLAADMALRLSIG